VHVPKALIPENTGSLRIQMVDRINIMRMCIGSSGWCTDRLGGGGRGRPTVQEDTTDNFWDVDVGYVRQSMNACVSTFSTMISIYRLCFIFGLMASGKSSRRKDSDGKGVCVKTVNVHIFVGCLGTSPTCQPHISFTGTCVRSLSRVMEGLMYSKSLVAM
jgi:hypothetical protein